MQARKIHYRSSLVTAAFLVATVTAVHAHPGPQPIDGSPNQPGPDWTLHMTDDGMTSVYQTPTSVFPQSYPFKTSHPSNLLPTIYKPLRDSGGDIIPNTLPSTPSDPYHLHPDPTVTSIDARSPRWDLGRILNELKAAVDPNDRHLKNKEFFKNGEGVPADPRRGRIEREGSDAGTVPPLSSQINYDRVQMAIDILEGNPINRSYSGMALLHYKGPDMIKKVDPETKTVTIHESWQHDRIMSDTMFVDPSTIPDDETWTMKYVVDDLFWGEEDFAPFATFYDDPRDRGGKSIANVGMDQSFFPMKPGHRYVFKIKMPPHRFWNLTYNWGWRIHPPRIQAIEKATKRPGGKNIVDWERDVFGDHPTSSREAKFKAISMISDLAPAKRMWLAFRAIESTRRFGRFLPPSFLKPLVEEAAAAFDDWKHRQQLPRGVDRAKGYDETIVYLNNMMYGGMNNNTGEAEQSFEKWQTRGATLKVKLLNGDYFPHFYMNVDFGGRRGWENIYQNTLPLGGQGPLFTFGRAYFFPNLKAPAQVPAAERGILSRIGTSAWSIKPESIGRSRARKALVRLSNYGVRDPGKVDAVAKKALKEAKAHGYDLTKTQLGMKLADKLPKIAFRDGLGEHNVKITFRFDPSKRLRFYQFDPMHHNEDILSVH